MKRIRMVLSHSSIQDCIRQLEEYKNGMQAKLLLVTERLANVGITIISADLGEYGAFIQVKKELKESTPENAKFVVAMINTQMVTRYWYRKGEIVEAEVNPVLMVEFGSGAYARNDKRARDVGAGRGTFPNERHAFDDDGWWWTTPDGQKHHSFGEQASAPLYDAFWAMYLDAITIIKEVFGNG